MKDKTKHKDNIEPAEENAQHSKESGKSHAYHGVHEEEKVSENEVAAGKDNKGKGESCGAKLAKLEKDYAELEGKRMLLLADMDNLRKRCAKDMEALRHNVMQDTLFPFLQVFEHFTMAVNAASKSDNYDSLLKGMEMIQQEFDRAFSDLGVVKVDAVGADFDPLLHEAVAQEPSDAVPAGKVIRQWSFGFKKGDRLLKPAMVVVSSGPASENK